MRSRVVWQRAVMVVAGSWLVCAQPAWAQDPVHKLGRGVVNVLTGWIELPKQIHRGKQEDNPVTGITHGVGRGLSLALLRTGLGLFEAVSFPVPYPAKFASPYEGMQVPDYAWE